MIASLVIAPHVDDEVLGCASILSPSCHVYFCGVEAFREVGRSERLEEAEAAARLLGHSWECDTDRTVNQYQEHELIVALEAVINRVKPLRVFIPYAGYNQDHRAVFNAAFVALRPHDRNHFVRQVLVYEAAHDVIWVPRSIEVNYFVPLDIERKIEAYRCHRSQVRGMRSPDTLRAIAAVRGAAIGVPHAEAFQILRWVDDRGAAHS